MGCARLILLLTLLAGCAGAPVYISDFCLIAKPIQLNESAWAVANTAVRQAVTYHNEEGEKRCGWEP